MPGHPLHMQVETRAVDIMGDQTHDFDLQVTLKLNGQTLRTFLVDLTMPNTNQEITHVYKCGHIPDDIGV